MIFELSLLLNNQKDKNSALSMTGIAEIFAAQRISVHK